MFVNANLVNTAGFEGSRSLFLDLKLLFLYDESKLVPNATT